MISSQQSRAINSTRLFMALGVILIHCNILEYIPLSSCKTSIMTYWIVRFFSEEWPKICVPWFFFISAYLCEKKYSSLPWDSYVSLLRKRSKSILVPYILWNTLALLISQIVNLTFLSKYTSGGYNFTSMGQFFIDVYVSPILVPLWFLRNLMIFILALPILKKLLYINPVLLIAVSIIIDNYTPLGGLTFYSIGLIFARYDSIINKIFKYSCVMGVSYSIIALYSTITGNSVFDIPLLGTIVIILGIFAFWGISQNITTLQISGSSGLVFFLYAFHGIISPYVIKGLALIIPFHGFGYIIYYMATFTIVVGFSYISYLLLRKVFPHALCILTGQRS